MIVLITDPSRSDDDLARIVRAAGEEIPRGKLAVLLRDKSRDDMGALALAQSLRAITRAQGHLFLVHRHHVRLAFEVGADGVHDPTPKLDPIVHKKDAPSAIVSVPAHSDDDVRHAVDEKIDWVLVSPIFATPEKGVPRGTSAIRNAAQIKGDRESPAIFALGGIRAENAASCMQAGALGIAVIRSIVHAVDPRAATRDLWKAIAPFLTIDS